MKKLLKDPVLGWLCVRCYDNRSDKNNYFINAVTLKCSLCDENLKFNYSTDGDGRHIRWASCPDRHTSISLPKCSMCGEKMLPHDVTLQEYKDKNPIEREIAIDYETKIKKPWWKF